MIFATEATACLFWFLYSSFYEWFAHRYFMHTKRSPVQWMFDGHTLIHHQIYKGENFLARGPGRPPHVTLRRTTFPGILLGHIPVFLLFQWLTGLPTFWGAVAGLTLYYAGYEYTHYLMHVPRGHMLERFRAFLFLREHHRLHHRYMQRNFNVLFPLADYLLGTLVTSEGRLSKPVKRRSRAARKAAALLQAQAAANLQAQAVVTPQASEARN